MKYVRDEANNLYEAFDKEEQIAAINTAVAAEEARARAAEEAEQTALNSKVDKVTGKGLSTNDFTDHHKEIVEAMETGSVTGVKGDAESTYRAGNVNITPANIGAPTLADETATRQLIAPIETTNNASQAYEPNDYLVWNNRLCVVTSLIASGNSLVLGSNIAYTTVGAEITDVKANKQDKSDNSLNTTSKNIVGAINELKVNANDAAVNISTLSSTKQSSTDYGLNTTAKTIVGAINEIDTNLKNKGSANITTDNYTANVRVGIAKVSKIGNKMVNIKFQATYNVDIPVSVAFANIPSAYRPKTSISVPASIKLSDGTVYFYAIGIATNGNITQPFSNTVREVLFDSIYEI